MPALRSFVRDAPQQAEQVGLLRRLACFEGRQDREQLAAARAGRNDVVNAFIERRQADGVVLPEKQIRERGRDPGRRTRTS